MKRIFLYLIFSQFVHSLCCAHPLVHTYSIVARDEKTGQMGVAVHSHWFAVGSRVAWAEAGVGAIATQAMTNAQYGPKGLGLMTRGISSERVLKLLLTQDKCAENRQVAIIGTKGEVAVHTGKNCIPVASHKTGPGFSVQANMMSNDRVVPAMAKAYSSAKGELAERLLAALRAAEQAGGDIRGCQSAAMKVVAPTKSGDPWQDIIVDIRVDDHTEPIKELTRLLVLTQAYHLRSMAAAELGKRNFKEAENLFLTARKKAPEKIEFSFWYALDLATHKMWNRATAIFRKVFAQSPKWKEVLQRLPGSSGLSFSKNEALRLVNEILDRAKSKPSDLQVLLRELAKPPLGSCAALVAFKGKKRMSFFAGREQYRGKKISEKTLFNIASVSKTLTAARIVSLCNQGRLNLPDSVAKYLPGVNLISPSGLDVTNDISIAHLLKHRSGLPHQPGNQLDPALFDNQWHSPKLIERLMKKWSLRLEFEPGEYHYSNMGYVLLAGIIEKVDKTDYASSMINYLSSKGMKEFSFLPKSISNNAAYGKLIKDGRVGYWPPKFYSSVYALPFTGAWISMSNLADFGESMMRASIDKKHELHIMAKTIKDYRGYGLGIVHQKRFSKSTLEHDGATNGFLCRLIIVPEDEIVMAVVTNGGGQTKDATSFLRITQDMLATLLTLDPAKK